MSKRLNDTAGLKAGYSEVRGPAGKAQSVSVRSERIENGYVTTTTRSDDSNWTETKLFTKERPDVAIETDAGPATEPNSMKRATDYLNR